MSKKLMGLIAALIAIIAMLAGSVPANAADYGDSITNESSSSATDEAQVTSKAKATGKITGKTVFYIKAKGTPKAKQTNCTRTKKAASYWTSYKDANGKEVWHWKHYPKGKKFCKIGKVMRDPVCHNKVKINVPKAKKPKGRIIKGKIVVKKSMKFVAEATAETTAHATSTAKAWCVGTSSTAEATAKATATASARARAKATATTRGGAEAKAKQAAGKVAASASFKSKVEVDALAKARAEATATAKAKVHCTDAPTPPPPPVTYDAPAASGSAEACVKQGEQNGKITVSGTNPNAMAAPGTFTIGGKTKSFTSVGAGQTVTWDFTGFAPGTYQGTFSLGAPISKSVNFSVTVNPCPVKEHKNPIAEIFFGEHAVDLHGTMPVFGRVRAYDGATATLGSPVVTPRDLGMVSNWRPVPTNKDGAPCEAGWVCYQGTFRVTKDGTPGTYAYGTMVAKATDSAGGEFTTQPKQFSVFYADHPET